MQKSCPKCSRQLPELVNLKYRFCPHCGAEITDESEKHEDVFLTIPPDSAPRQPEQRPEDLASNTDAGRDPAPEERFNDKTVAPQSVARRPRPELKPPDMPPPPGFFRTAPADKANPTVSPEKAFLKQQFKNPSPSPKRKKIIIAILLLLAVIILIMGGLITF